LGSWDQEFGKEGQATNAVKGLGGKGESSVGELKLASILRTRGDRTDGEGGAWSGRGIRKVSKLKKKENERHVATSGSRYLCLTVHIGNKRTRRKERVGGSGGRNVLCKARQNGSALREPAWA